MATTPTIKRILRLEDLVEGFDPRFGYRQFIPYWTQLPDWWTAKDAQGRTPFMVGLLSTKGANPEFYLTPGTREALTARDSSGRNLWNYAWRTLFYGSRSPTWEEVLTQVPLEVNPVSGRGLFTDALLNTLPHREHTRTWRRPTLMEVLPAQMIDGSLSQSQTMAGWAERNSDAWWACPEADGQALFQRMLHTSQWSGVDRKGDSRLMEALKLTRKETDTPLPAAWVAVQALVNLLSENPDAGMKAMEEGAMDGFLDTRAHHGAIVRLDLLNKDAQARLGRELTHPVQQWWARAVERQMDLRLPQANGSERKPKARL